MKNLLFLTLFGFFFIAGSMVAEADTSERVPSRPEAPGHSGSYPGTSPILTPTGTMEITLMKFEVDLSNPNCSGEYQLYLTINDKTSVIKRKIKWGRTTYSLNVTHRVKVKLLENEYLRLKLGFQVNSRGQRCFSFDERTLVFSPLVMSELGFAVTRADTIANHNKVRLYYKMEYLDPNS